MRTLFSKLGQVGWSFPIILALLALCIASLFAITSATYSNDALRDAPASQTRYIVAGFLVYLALALTPYQVLVRISPILYAVGVCLLVACFIPHIGKKTFGAYSWIKLGPFGFEPAEFAKLTYILGLAWFLRVRENQIQSLSTVIIALIIAAIPFVLVLKQPALGTASVFFPVCFAMLWAAGCASASSHHSAGAGREHRPDELLLDPRLGQTGPFAQAVSGRSHQDFLRSEPRSQRCGLAG